jgi:hypothetical protein
MSLPQITVTPDLPYSVPPIEYPDLPKHPTKSWDTIERVRNPEDINTIIVHHMASEAPLDKQALYHVNTHQWPGLSYHLVVSSGRLMQINDLLWFTYHASGHNPYTVSISIHGDLSKREMTSHERELLYAGILSLKAVLPITTILGHNEVNATACPCTSMNQIRDDIAQLEMKIKSAVDPAKAKDEIIKSSNQHFYLFNTYLKDPSNKWLEGQLLELYKRMDELNLFFNR